MQLDQPLANPLFEISLSYDTSKLLPLKVFDATKWSQIEMRAAISDVEIDHDMFLFLLVGAGVFKNLNKIMLECIATTDYLTANANKLDTAQVAYALTNPRLINQPVVELWMHHVVDSGVTNRVSAGHDPHETNYMQPNWNYDLGEYDLNASVKRGYEIMKTLDRRFPLMFVKFFANHAKTFARYDEQFIAWICMMSKMKAQINSQFQEIYDAVIKERDRILSHAAFLT